ncbi:hypothetical protein [Streptomyces sp. NBC_00448]|uniref:hypothetical protein n=1 Tax=Streptomyces sp. NBC_00448 TaxID=2903652 RepID=UPI002E1E12E5
MAGLAVLVAGCGSGSSTPKATASPAAPPPVGVPLATKLLEQYSSTSNAITLKNVKTLSAIEEPPASVASKAGLTVAKAQKIQVTDRSFVTPRFVFPRVTSYPHYFLAIAPMLQSDRVTPEPVYTLFVQDQPSAKYKVAYYPLATDTTTGPPTLEEDSADGAPEVTSSSGLLAPPGALAKAYNDFAQGHKDADVPLAPSQALTVDLAGNFTANAQELKSRGGVLNRVLLSHDYPSYMLRTRDGGVLAFSAVKVQDTMTSSSGYGTVALDPGSPEAAMAGSPQGAHSSQYVIDRLEVYLSVIPPASTPGPGVQLLGFSDYLLSVDG